MDIAERLIDNLKTLPESIQAEVLDFMEYLKLKTEREEQKEWSAFSLASAMQGMEDEESLYTLDDIKETFS
jgi:hypothetical protein